MTSAVALPHPALRVLHGLLALALASSWLVAAALPASAQAIDWGVESPGPNHVIHGPFTLAGFAESVQDPQAVRARIRRPDDKVELRNLRLAGEPEVRGVTRRSTWTTEVGGDALPLNGTYTLEVQVVSPAHEEGSPWQGHQVIVDRPPVAELAALRVTDGDARTVEVSWVRSDAGDFIRYVLQRAHGDGAFADVHTAVTADATAHVDTVPEHGDYRYRIKTVRRGADGGEREAVSGHGKVTVRAGPGGRAESGQEPDTTPGADQGPGSAAAPPSAPSTRRSGGGSSGGSSGRARIPSREAQERANATFEEQLDYGVDLPDWDPEAAGQERESALNDAGTLTVFDQETDTRTALVPVAGGLVLTLFGLHIVRFLREDPGPAVD